DDGDQLALGDREAHAVDRHEVAVALVDVDRLDQRAHVGVLRCRRAHMRSKRPDRPRGKSTTSRIRIAPSQKRQYWVSPTSCSLRKMNENAPTTGPRKLPNPPSTVMNTSSPEWVQ